MALTSLIIQSFGFTQIWYAPLGCVTVSVMLVGGGAGGQGGSGSGGPSGGIGGGGGACAVGTIAVTPSQGYTVTVGTGGDGGGTPGIAGNPGGDSRVTGDDVTLLAVGAPGQSGGLAANCLGTSKSSGGNGGSASLLLGGGGGSAAYSVSAGAATASGTNATGQMAGTNNAGAPFLSGYGNGGNGGNAEKVGVSAFILPGGGGGGGGGSNANAQKQGGSGADGKVWFLFLTNAFVGPLPPGAWQPGPNGAYDWLILP